MEFSRTDPAYAKVVFEKLLPEPETRRAVLELLAKLIEVANVCPDKWGVTLHGDRVAFNVGGGYYAFWLKRATLDLYWIGDGQDDPPNARSSFLRIPNSRATTLSAEQLVPWFEKLLPRVREFIAYTNSTSRKPLMPQSQRSHSPGVLRYMESELGITLPDPAFPEPLPGFTWIPFFSELTEKVLAYRDRQADLLDQMRSLQQSGLMIGALTDRDESGAELPLAVYDPFTFFSSFVRPIRPESRLRLLEALKSLWELESALPSDLDGVPLVNNQNQWFFGYAHKRSDGDIDALWDLAAQAHGGRDEVTVDVWQRALDVRMVGLPKLTMGLFWLNPDEFLPLDQNVQQYLRKNQITVPTSFTWSRYKALCEEAQEKLGKGFPEISRDAYKNPTLSRYWAGGHQWGETSMLSEFLAESAWWHGFGSPMDNTAARQTYERFAEIRVGDYFAIKGYGGAGSLKVYFVGQVVEKDDAEKKVLLEPLPLPTPPSIRPGRGKGSWFGTLREVTDPAVIAWMFEGKPYVSGEPIVSEEEASLPDFSLNSILYGPPGTGKTYETARRAVEIVDGAAPEDRAAVMARYRELQQAGRIGFVTFHQSYSYEDFVEGIRPVMDDTSGDGGPRYQIVDGILKSMARKAEGFAPSASSSLQTFSRVWDVLLEEVETHPEREYPGLSANTTFQFTVTETGNLRMRNIQNPDTKEQTLSREKAKDAWELYSNTSDKAAEAFLTTGNYPARRVVFRELIRLANELPSENAPSRFVLIVDEINRGNISKILGELITLLEDDKRLGRENELTVTLPYSRESFGLPSNLYLIGTMNTADKSLALLDVALRRRFEFEELAPDFGVCGLVPEMRTVLEELNRRITLRKDRDHRIGHAFFMGVGSDVDTFNAAFHRKIVPLLQEYFFNDWDGVRYALGEKDGQPRFVVPLDGAGEKGARNKWQWYYDASSKPFDALGALAENYGPPSA